MSKQMKPVTDLELNAYVDGELDAHRRLEVEAWLATHVDARKRVDDYRAITQQLHTRFDTILSEPAEFADTPGSGKGFSFARAAAVAALMLLSGLTGWMLDKHDLEMTPQTLADLVEPAAFAHAVYSMDSRYPVEIAGVEKTSLNQWVSSRMHADLQAPELATIGLSLVGGRLLPSTNRMAAQFMYEDDNGKRLTVYVRRISDENNLTDFQYREQDGLNVFYWIDNTMGYAVIGDHQASRLIEVAHAVKTAFSQQHSTARATP
ncbi:MAG: anti-sigma factor [Chromatiales bacterium]|jgi:anti-sigma factor RsiW